MAYNYHKAGKSKHELENKKTPKKEMSQSDRWRHQIKLWTSFYRANPHRFVKDYLGIELFLFQKILIYLMMHYPYFMYWAARGQGKSYIIAIYCCVRAILFPGSKILVASFTKGQAKLIITQKIDKELRSMSPMLAREIKYVKTSTNECVVYFHNGSYIEAIVSSESARGFRGNVIICDEFRMIDKNNIDKVIRPMLNVLRQPPFMKLPKYRNYQKEQNVEVYISSAWYKGHWSYESFKTFTNNMLEHGSHFACGLNYRLNIDHGLITEERIEELKREEDFDPVSFQLEYETVPYGESERSYYKLNDIIPNRTVKKAIYPIENEDYVAGHRKKNFPKKRGETRLLGVDVALMAGEQNDNSIITLVRMLPNGDSYRLEVPYIESINGRHSEEQAIRIKQLYHDLDCDVVVLDSHGNGMAVFDALAKINYDNERDIEYDAWTSFNDEEMRKRAITESALPIIYTIKANPEINHKVSVGLRDLLQRGKLRLLVDEIQAKETIMMLPGYKKTDQYARAKLLTPYLQTTALLNELVNLEYTINSGFIRVKEVGRNRKDRYSSLGYACYYAKIKEAESKRSNNVDWSKYCLW
jgi:hypothetical protein